MALRHESCRLLEKSSARALFGEERLKPTRWGPLSLSHGRRHGHYHGHISGQTQVTHVPVNYLKVKSIIATWLSEAPRAWTDPWLRQRRGTEVPLLERSPAKFWKGVSALLALVVLLLAWQLWRSR